MIGYFIFTDNSIGQAYGIGTYVRQLVSCLMQIDRMRIYIVVLNANVDRFSLIQESCVCKVLIPKCTERERFEMTMDEAKKEKYYRSVAYLLALLELPERCKVFFHMNDCEHFGLLKYLRSLYQNAEIIVTMHYLRVLAQTSGNICLLKKVIFDSSPLEERMFAIRNCYEAESLFLKSIDRVICLNDDMRNLLVEYFGLSCTRLATIPNGVDGEYNNNDNTKKALKKKFQLENKTVFLFVGRIEEAKGIFDLLQAFKLFVNAHKDSYLIVVGDGALSFALEMVCSTPQILFTGKLNKDKLEEYYQVADVGILPSYHEQSSFVAIEMMQHGLPLIATNSFGLREMVQKCSVFVAKEDNGNMIDIHSLYHSMEILYKNRGLRERLRVEARKNFMKNYTLDIMMFNYIRFVESIENEKGFL